MAYFECVIGGGGTSMTILFTTSDTSLYGQTITISKSGTTVGTTAFDNTGHAEYTVKEAGTYSVVCGAASDTVEVTDEFPVELSAIPDGSTVTPVNDIQTWLQCAGIFNKTSYTTLAAVLADTTTLLALINSNNAVDYMVRSHAWCDDVCADATAMTYIGANNYAADTLLADDGTGNWLESICNSTYFESVLNVKVPTMTSNTTPSGECSGYSYNTFAFGNPVYYAFDKSYSTTIGTIYSVEWANSTSGDTPGYIQYMFQNAIKTYKCTVRSAYYTGTSPSYGLKGIVLEGSNDGTTFTQITTATRTDNSNTDFSFSFEPTIAYKYYRFKVGSTQSGVSSPYSGVSELQFYGRAA